MKYLVTGGAGFIGSALVRRLTAAGEYVVVLDDFSRGNAQRLYGTGADLQAGDVRDRTDVLAAVHGCDMVIHLAYLQGTQTFYADPRQVLDVAVRGMRNILEACERFGTTQLMLVSSSEAYQVAPVVPTPEEVPLMVPDPLNPRYSYGGGKIISELMSIAWARAGVLDRLMIVRPHNICGPDMGREHVLPEFAIRMNDLVREHPKGIIPFPIQGSGQETRSFCDIDDCIDQLMLLLYSDPPVGSDGPQIVNVGTMEERRIAQVAHEVARCYDREIKVNPGTLPKGSPPRRLPDLAKMHALGYVPRYGFEQVIERTVAWYKLHG